MWAGRSSTKSRADYGTIRARIENVVNFPIIVQLTNDKEEVIQENILNNQFNTLNYIGYLHMLPNNLPPFYMSRFRFVH